MSSYCSYGSMDEGFSFESVISSLRSNLLLVSLSLIGVVLIGLGYFMLDPSQPKDSIVYEAGKESQDINTVPNEKAKGTIYVDVSGAVHKPGVYELPETARVQDALHSAGGLSDDADMHAVAKAINLASKITDGMKLYFPFRGEGQGAIMGVSTTNSGGLINLNNASLSQLESLPGIGAVTAQKILNGRPYATVEEVKSKKVVGSSVYEKIKDQVTVN